MRQRFAFGAAILGLAMVSLGGEKVDLHGAARKGPDPGQFVCFATVLDASTGEVLLQKELHAGVGEPAQAVSGNQDSSKSGTENRFSCSISKDLATANIRYVRTTFVGGKRATISSHETEVPIK
jgi:hypothetical protein